MDVELLSYSSNLIDVKVSRDDGSRSFRFTGVYGNPNVLEKDRSWQILKNLLREEGSH